MVVYVEDADPVDVELLGVEEAHVVLTRLKGELVAAYNAAHAECVRRAIAEVEGQIAWLESEAAEVALAEAAAEHADDLWADYDLGIPA
ncbi:hypothetical protein QRB38_13265 [Mycobacterium avium subsp. hominissuis]|uniref:hypothetical protein n=1 Tax=Mycobacterium avium TaxID=1764 RepID=UPI002665D623|nr:hypothetical protein [Mycobacterium avium]MDO2394780.1 hypothetical protein [Mycobacterium avium subsp. hominissuis]